MCSFSFSNLLLPFELRLALDFYDDLARIFYAVVELFILRCRFPALPGLTSLFPLSPYYLICISVYPVTVVIHSSPYRIRGGVLNEIIVLL